MSPGIQYTNLDEATNDMKWRFRLPNAVLAALVFAILVSAMARLATGQAEKPKAPPSPGPMLTGGILVLNTPDFNVNLVRADSCRAETESRRR